MDTLPLPGGLLDEDMTTVVLRGECSTPARQSRLRVPFCVVSESSKKGRRDKSRPAMTARTSRKPRTTTANHRSPESAAMTTPTPVKGTPNRPNGLGRSA